MLEQVLKVVVEAIWDDEAEVWVATSDDVPGLVTEAETAEQLEQKLLVMIPEMLKENGIIQDCDHPEIPVELLSKRDFFAKAC
jgi:predicted RNase H-like HicB family nuclease